MNEQTKVVIAGFPKSGNTWLTRLCAQIIGCPVKGYWQSNHDEIAVEGQERKSSFSCYKTHDTWDKLQGYKELPSYLIYICRDPRDVFLSGMHYFYDLDPLKPKKKTYFSRLINRLYKEIVGNRKMAEKMLSAIINGDSSVHSATSVSWFEHLQAYRNNTRVLFIRYEDLLDQPLIEARRITDYVNVEKSDEELLESVERQSFNTSLKRYEDSNDEERRDFMRRGKSEQWRTNMSDKMKGVFKEELGQNLKLLGYPLK